MTRALASEQPREKHGLRLVAVDRMAALRSQGFTLGEWHVEPKLLRMTSATTAQRLDPRTMDVLVFLASRSGDVVERDALLDAVWGTSFVTENTLTQAVSRLRRALGDHWQKPTFLETISKSGYRLVAPVSVGPPNDESAAGEHARADPAPSRPWPPVRLLWAGGAVIAVALAILGVTRPASKPETSILAARPALTHVGPQYHARLSPDGSRIAFAWQGPALEGWDLYVQQVDAETPRRLTTDAANEGYPAWSPDGLSLAFVRADADGACGIFRLPAMGGAAERLGDCVPGIRHLRWSPDGSRLIMSGIPEGNGPSRVLAFDLDSRLLTPLTDPPANVPGDVNPVLSPNGELLAFSRVMSGHRHDLFVVPVAGGAPRLLTADVWGRIRGLDFRADGDRIVYSSNRTGRFYLWQIPVAGGPPERLPIEDGWVTLPVVARDDSRLIYKNYTDVVDLWQLTLDKDGRAIGEPVARMQSTRSEMDPILSPDASAIAFVSDRSGFTELWSGGLDGTALYRHSNLQGPRPGGASWSPDGKQLVYDAAPAGQSDLFVVDRDSRRPRRLTRTPTEEKNPTFGQSGDRVFFASDRSGAWQIWRMPEGGGEAVQVTRNGGFLAQEAPGGGGLFVARLDEPGIWHLPASGGDATQVVTGLDLADWSSWTVGGRGIYYFERATRTIVLQPVDAQKIAVWTAPKTLPFLGRAFTVAADERSMVVAMIGRSDDEVLVVDLNS